MKIRETGIEGLLIIEPLIFSDQRGYFFESYLKKNFNEAPLKVEFIQDNQSKSTYGVIRGLHYQRGEFSQAKLVRVVQGAIFDVAVDLRSGSSTYGKWFGMELNENNFLQLLIPRGFAHGFSVISETATVFYKCDNYYNKESEGGIRYNDPELDINWQIPADKEIVSEKDSKLPLLRDLNGK